MRNYEETLQWYKTHQTTSQIGFDPDGMCLKICRTARGIGSRYGSAKKAQDATPANHRVHKIANLRKGMVIYYDDPNDSNKFGHIVTMVGRAKGGDRNNLHDILVETNSVKANEVVVVHGDYFPKNWGDKFQFGATWLNGMVLDVPSSATAVQKFKKTAPNYNVKLLDDAVKKGRNDLAKFVTGFNQAVDALPDDTGKKTRVRSFTEYYKKQRVMKMTLLNDAISKGNRGSAVETQRDKIRQLIKALPSK
jgi:hypothetical protein